MGDGMEWGRTEQEPGVGDEDQESSGDEMEVEGFVGVIDVGGEGDPGGEEQGDEGGEDGFCAVEEAGLGGGDPGLPVVGQGKGDEGAEAGEQGEEDDGGGAVVGLEDGAGIGRGGEGHGPGGQGHDNEHDGGGADGVVAAEKGSFQPQDLSGEKDAAGKCLPFASPEMEVVGPQSGEQCGTEERQQAGAHHLRRRPAEVSDGEPEGDEDAIGLGEEGGSGGEGVHHAIHLEDQSDSTEETKAAALPDFESGEAVE